MLYEGRNNGHDIINVYDSVSWKDKRTAYFDNSDTHFFLFICQFVLKTLGIYQLNNTLGITECRLERWQKLDTQVIVAIPSDPFSRKTQKSIINKL